jgi:hypothetical protein
MVCIYRSRDEENATGYRYRYEIREHAANQNYRKGKCYYFQFKLEHTGIYGFVSSEKCEMTNQRLSIKDMGS